MYREQGFNEAMAQLGLIINDDWIKYGDFHEESGYLGLVGNYTLWSAEWTNAVNKGDFAAQLGAGWLKGWMEGNAPEASGHFKVATLPTEFAANWGGSYISIPSETLSPI